jgi:hypothetical protein
MVRTGRRRGTTVGHYSTPRHVVPSNTFRMPHTFNHETDDWSEIKVTWFDDALQRRRPKIEGGKARR